MGSLEKLRELEAQLDAQKKLVCELKEKHDKKSPEVMTAVTHLKALTADVKALTKELAAAGGGGGAAERLGVDRTAVEILLKRRFFFAPSFEIYNGVKGLFDLGPPGCAVQANIVALWRQHFVLGEDLLEIDCVNVTPDIVLQVSGHKEKFLDFMVFDEKTHEPFRADHLLEAAMDELSAAPAATKAQLVEYENVKAQADALSMQELGEALVKYKVVAPGTKNKLTPPQPFNLMFSTQIGATGKEPAFLRPETAQGIFVNFKRLLEFNHNKLPFGAAQVGKGFRNEISPQQGLLRVREFTLAEIEYFVHPERKQHERFAEVAGVRVRLYDATSQVSTHAVAETTIGEAVQAGTINNETLGYFMARTQQFFEIVGIDAAKMRFRQHLRNEMAHYACDCWDAEVLTSYGWIEVVGHADRSAYDLEQHSAGSRRPLHVFEAFAHGEMREEDAVEVKVAKGVVGKAFRKDAKAIMEYFDALSDVEAARRIAATLADAGKYTLKVADDREFELTKDMLSVAIVKKKVTGVTYTPNVIEPAFGIGRILYCALEHAFRSREGDEQRNYLSLAPSIAPVKVSVLPLLKQDELLALVPRIRTALVNAGLSCKVDLVESIGRRYARLDEIGIPFAVTIDFETLKDDTVTLRERDSMDQRRLPINDVPAVLNAICTRQATWETAVVAKYPEQKKE